jgi:hypothetical protein
MTTVNRERAARALNTLKSYAAWGAHEMGPSDTCDLLTDLMHLHGVPAFDYALKLARMYYDIEENEGAS